jgi:GT2 family glycosyltransferase
MIAFGCAVTDREMFERVALPGIERLREPDSLLLTRCGYDEIHRAYNEMMDEAVSHPDLEALILLHQDLELLDDSLLERVRPQLERPGVGVIGCFGGRNVPFQYWSLTEEKFGSAMVPAFEEHYSSGPHEVEVVDGVLLALNPWVARTIRFSEAASKDFHGYDVDFCMRVRAAGGRVVCDDVPYLHHMEHPWADADQLRRAGYALARMWDPALRPPEWDASFQR